jgi:hypothetical protein
MEDPGGVVTGALFLVASLAMAGAPDKVDFTKYKDKKSAVSFDHKAHVGRNIQCATCHHKAKRWKEGGLLRILPSEGGAGTTPSFQDAFHKQCKDCHKKEGKGPTKCAECHK